MAENETPETEEQQAQSQEEAPAVDDRFMEELKRAGITSPSELKGKLDAGAQAGRLAQLLGNTRQEAENLKREMAELRAAARKQDFDMSDYEESKPVDLKKVIAETIREERKREAAEAQQAQQVVYQTWNRIQSDPDYNLVKPVWENALRDPNFVSQIQQGIINPVDAYNNIVRNYYKGIVRQSHDTISKLRGVTPKTVTKPHMETGTNVPPTPEEITENRAKVDAMKERVNKGGNLSEDEELAALNAIIGDV